jgi:hypothetical protein
VRAALPVTTQPRHHAANLSRYGQHPTIFTPRRPHPKG